MSRRRSEAIHSRATANWRMLRGMTDENPPTRTKTKIGDILFGWKSAVVIFIGGLILGGLGGVGIGSMGHHHHPRGDRFTHMRGGFQGGDGSGGFRGGYGYGGPGGMPMPPNMGVPPNTQRPNGGNGPSSSATPKAG
jgi:hypothetical protein